VSTTGAGGHGVTRIRERGPRMALTHRVLIVAGPAGVEFHLDHRIAPGRGQHRIVGSEDLAAWMADAGDVHPAFEVATTCPCRRNRAQSGGLRQGGMGCLT
jgi:hypothetical protein